MKIQKKLARHKASRKRRLFSIGLIFLMSFYILVSVLLVANPPKVLAATNNLLLIQSKCHDFQKTTTQGGKTPSQATGTWKDCTDAENVLQDKLGCSPNMFDQKKDPNDSGGNAKLNQWYTDGNNFAECYGKALAKLEKVAGDHCKSMPRPGDTWDDCQTEQDRLHDALNCDDHMFTPVPGKNGYWTQIQGRIDSCRSKIVAIGNLKIPGPFGTNGKTVKEAADNPTQTNPGGGSNTDSNSCEGKFNFGMEWLFCPMLRVIDDIVSNVNNIIEDQLNFDVGQNLNDHVKQAWSIFRILSTILLIIIMLIMIFAQASGGGPFEAYTIRKLLPKIVIAIILIQLSWVMFKYFVVLANDAGRGIGDLLAAPFGGQDAINLPNLLGKLGELAPGIALTTASLATGAAFVLNPFGALMVAFVVFVAVMTALATLLFREALIIACIIFGPIALVAWILPGTARYWKMWYENFAKALLLFPIIVSLIIIGRIFAWIVGTAGGDAGILDLIAVIVGFFGPYLLLPKAFSWGGLAMSIASKGISAGTTKAVSPVKTTLDNMKGRSRWTQARAARKAELDRRAKIGFAGGLGDTGPLRGGINRARLGGLGRPRAEREIRGALARRGIEQAENEEIKAASEVLDQEITRVDDHDQFLRALAAGPDGRYQVGGQWVRAGDRTSYDGYERVAALSKLAEFGGAGNMRAIEEAQASMQANPEDRALYRKFVNTNSDKLLGPMKHIVYGGDTPDAVHATIDSLGPAGVAAMDGVQMETLLGSLTTTLNDADQAALHPAAQQDLRTLLSAYHAAATNENIRPNIKPSTSRAVKAFVDGGTLLDTINMTRTDGPNNVLGPVIPGSPIIVQHANGPEGIGHTLNIDPILQHLHDHVDDTGTITPP